MSRPYATCSNTAQARTVALRRGREGKEELRRVGVLSRVGHGEHARCVVPALEAALLVIKLAPVNALPRRAVIKNDVAALAAEPCDHAMEGTPAQAQRLQAASVVCVSGVVSGGDIWCLSGVSLEETSGWIPPRRKRTSSRELSLLTLIVYVERCKPVRGRRIASLAALTLVWFTMTAQQCIPSCTRPARAHVLDL